ncbi:MAG: metallophosphoesterase family protein, partial [Clostridium sp.]
GIRVYITHGHLFNKDNMLKVSKKDVIVHGHTHILDEMIQEEVKIINPGSISYPKNDNPHTYGVLEGKVFTIKDIEGNIIKSIAI